MTVKSCFRYSVLLLTILSMCRIDISAQNTISSVDSTFYQNKINELENELILYGIGNSRLYNLAAYHSLLGETEPSISYLNTAIDSNLIILHAIVDADLENVRVTEEWPAIHKKILGNWYGYYPFGDAEYALELIEMKDNYLRQRKEVDKVEQEFGDKSDEYWEAVKATQKLGSTNGEKLDSLIRVHGWPRQNFVGQEQTRAAALALVYSELPIQKKYLSEIEKAVEYNEIEGRYFAIITDKILVADGEKQRYGTQYVYKDSTDSYEIAPIENETDLDKRRFELGMESMEEYLEGLNVIR